MSTGQYPSLWKLYIIIKYSTQVTPNAPIYFYQFSSPVAPTNLTWTGRFTIAGTDGSSTTASETTDGIAWGNGALVDPSSAVAAPSYLSGGASASGTVSVNTTVSTSAGLNTTVVSITPASSPSVATIRTTSAAKVTAGSGSSSSLGSSTDAPSSTTTTSGAAGFALDLRTRGVQSLISLAGTALAFVFLA